jgi:hypothetical protein
MLEKIARHIYVEKLSDGRVYKTGLTAPIKLEERSFMYAQLGGAEQYKPKFDKRILPTLSVKDQSRKNTCTWNAYTVMREPTEGKILNVRSIVIYARLKALLSKDGYSDLSSNHKAGCDFGIAEEGVDGLIDDPELDWEEYSNPKLLTEKLKADAYTHRADYRKVFYVSSISEYLKAIDDGHIIEVGFDWYSGYNMAGGLTAPWILQWGKGSYVGGHGVVIKGYQDLVLDEQGNTIDGLLVIQNSYSKDWGKGGDCFVRIKDFITKNRVTGMVEIDLTDDQVVEFIKSYEGKFVRSSYSPAIYKIENGQKRAFPDDFVYSCFGGRFSNHPDGKNWELVAQSLLDQIPDGSIMDVRQSPFWDTISPYWEQVRRLQNPGNLARFVEVIRDQEALLKWINGAKQENESWLGKLKQWLYKK